MAEEGDVLINLDNQPAPNGADTQPAAAILTQYVKDMSVENPNAPAVYQWQGNPQVDVQFNIGALPVSEEVTEITLKVNIEAAAEQGTVYILELAYCGLVGIRNVPDEQAHAFMFSEAPRILFPFARRIISDAVRDSGFPPLMIDPIDFNGLYIQQLQARRAQEAAAGEAPPETGEG